MADTLITPSQVIQTAFRPSDFIREQSVSTSDILSAEQKYISPVLGELYPALQSGSYPTLLSDYILPALALYVKAVILPRLWMQNSDGGVVQIKTDTLQSASVEQLNKLISTTLGQAAALMRRAVQHIESSAELYPEYDSRHNILNRCTIAGGIIITSSHGADL